MYVTIAVGNCNFKEFVTEFYHHLPGHGCKVWLVFNVNKSGFKTFVGGGRVVVSCECNYCRV